MVVLSGMDHLIESTYLSLDLPIFAKAFFYLKAKKVVVFKKVVRHKTPTRALVVCTTKNYHYFIASLTAVSMID